MIHECASSSDYDYESHAYDNDMVYGKRKKNLKADPGGINMRREPNLVSMYATVGLWLLEFKLVPLKFNLACN